MQQHAAGLIAPTVAGTGSEQPHFIEGEVDALVRFPHAPERQWVLQPSAAESWRG